MVWRGEAHPLKTEQVKGFCLSIIDVKIAHSIVLLDCTSGKYWLMKVLYFKLSLIDTLENFELEHGRKSELLNFWSFHLYLSVVLHGTRAYQDRNFQ